MTRRILTVAVAVLSLLVLASEPGGAKIGTGVGAGPITLAAPARAGNTYNLPSLWVVNTGDETSVYRVAVDPNVARGDARRLARGWVKVAQGSFALTPGQGRWVPLSLHVPPTAPAGRYRANLVAGTVRDNSGGAGVGASAATELRFTIGGRAPIVDGGSDDRPVWLVGGALVLAAGATAARRGARRRRAVI